MARLADRLVENVPGDFFVDRSCIDCDTCRQIAPDVFRHEPDVAQSVVYRQPAAPEDRMRAAMALVACPTASIGTSTKGDAAAAASAFPELLDGDVYYCGYAAESSFGASSYLVRRPEGNVLVDSPRAAKPLMKRIAELGGVRTMVLSHRDDVADHAAIHAAFGCARVIHRSDIQGGTAAAEIPVDGRDPVRLDADLTVLPVPGHTRGSIALLYRDAVLFTGDHLWFSETLGRLHASRSVCWYSWAEQTRSMERLLDVSFEWVLPGHGRRYRARSRAAMRQELEQLCRWMRGHGA
jgi:glyoxylase-like metal-dependent hydrolase (beta-lactamase superfamily II)